MDYIIEDIFQNELGKYIPAIWEILEKSYEKLGGFKSYQSENEMEKRLKFARLAIDPQGNLRACAIYRTYPDESRKLIGIGSDGSEVGKEAAREIIQKDIQEKDLHYWCEASGAIEYLFKKYNGFPIPNDLVASILEMSSKRIQKDPDKIHYYRSLLLGGEPVRKMMFGFRSQAVYDRVLKTVENYEEFREISNKLSESFSYQDVIDVKNSLLIIDKILDLYMEEQIREFPPKWRKMLQNCIDVLETSEATKEFKPNIIKDYIEYGKDLAKVPLLELHPLDLSQVKAE